MSELKLKIIRHIDENDSMIKQIICNYFPWKDKESFDLENMCKLPAVHAILEDDGSIVKVLEARCLEHYK